MMPALNVEGGSWQIFHGLKKKQQIGLQYALENCPRVQALCQEKTCRRGFDTPAERAELEEELYNVQQAADHAEELKGVYDKICILLCQMKDIRNSIRRLPGRGRCRIMWSCLK